jgi:hypothetical protein
MKDLLWHLCEQQILRFPPNDRRASLRNDNNLLTHNAS